VSGWISAFSSTQKRRRRQLGGQYHYFSPLSWAVSSKTFIRYRRKGSNPSARLKQIALLIFWAGVSSWAPSSRKMGKVGWFNKMLLKLKAV